MAASMEKHIEYYFTGDSKDASKQLAQEINKGNSNFLKFIELLGNYLSNPDNVTRGRATQLIGDVLDLLPFAFLTSDQVAFVTKFLLAKLSDHHTIQPHALQTLSTLTNRCFPLPEGLPEEICKTIFREIQNQSLSHADRRATYTIFQNLIGSAKKAIEEMGGDFIIGFIQQMDSEKDPRNLIICFNIAHFISSNLYLGPFTEEMFEILGCYFPIDFTPPLNDPHGITKKELVEALRKCLAANSEFAQYCLPLFLEKMTSDLQEARKDAMLSLIECAPVYGSKGLTEYIGSLTSTLKREVLMNVSADLVSIGKEAVKAVYQAFTPAQEEIISKDNIMAQSIVELYQDVVKYLQGSDVKKSALAFGLMQSVAASSASAFCIVTSLILPGLIVICTNLNQASEQLMFLRELQELLHTFKQFQINHNVVQVVEGNLPSLLALFEDKLNNVDNAEIQLEAMKALSILTLPPVCSTPETAQRFANTLVVKSLQDAKPGLRQQTLASLHNVVKESPSLGTTIIQSLVQKSGSCNNKLVLDAMIHAVIDEDSFKTVNGFLISKIALDVATNNVSDMLDCTQTMGELVSQQASDRTCMDLVVSETALPLLRTAVSGYATWADETKDKCAAVMSSLRKVFTVISCSIQKRDVTALWDKFPKLMLDSDASCIDIVGDFQTLKPFKPDSPWQQTRLVALLEGFVIGGDIQAMIEQREAIFEAAYVLGEHCEDDFTQLSACRLVAAIFNKVPIGGQIHWLLEPLTEKLKVAMGPNQPSSAQLRALRMWTWLTKATECRGHSATGILSSYLVSFLADPFLGAEVAVSLGLIVQDMDDIFTLKLKGNITPLYKQRFFTLNFKNILDGFSKAATREIKQNYLTAISCITSNLPLQVMKPHLVKLVPLLLMSLQQDSKSSLSHTLTTLSSAIVNVPDVIVPSVDDLVTLLMDLAKSHVNMKVRLIALKCLENLTALPLHAVAPHQNNVVRDLAGTLDDKKRLVRKQAVDTRCAWILLEKTKI
ncbi:unnamed protein product [Lymnaea stagnalis]|uniref:MMS19 nucleotide excision repair protein n=1 Tax=Lymnaea stagnalis TaxID=6523 RepID=A0AAV2HRB2_LYMST